MYGWTDIRNGESVSKLVGIYMVGLYSGGLYSEVYGICTNKQTFPEFNSPKTSPSQLSPSREGITQNIWHYPRSKYPNYVTRSKMAISRSFKYIVKLTIKYSLSVYL